MEDIFTQEILEKSIKQNQEDRFNQVDILVKNHKGELILIEVQNKIRTIIFIE